MTYDLIQLLIWLQSSDLAKAGKIWFQEDPLPVYEKSVDHVSAELYKNPETVWPGRTYL